MGDKNIINDPVRKRIFVEIVCLGVGYGCRNSEVRNYTVKEKDSANFSVFVSMLYPKEHLMVKVYDYIILDRVGKGTTGNPTAMYYFCDPAGRSHL